MGNDKTPVIINTETTKIFAIKIFLLIISAILFFILIKLLINITWATSSNIIKVKSTKRLKNLYKSTSNWIPSKSEWITKHTADPTPKNKKYLFLLKSLFIACIKLLYALQYIINRIAVMNIPGLNIR